MGCSRDSVSRKTESMGLIKSIDSLNSGKQRLPAESTERTISGEGSGNARRRWRAV
jgi:hypothetical protein